MKHLTKAILAVSAMTILMSCSPVRNEQPNVVLVTIDTLRWDYLNTYGFPDTGHTPAATWLAENGTVFTNAVSTAGTTIPSHASMLTGLYARQHGARSNFHNKYPGVPTITTTLKEAGYQTGAFVSNIFLFNIGGLAEGFEATNFPKLYNANRGAIFTGDRSVAAAVEWLDGLDRSRPFFSWLHLWEPHGPYELNDWSRDRLGDYDGLLKNGVSLSNIRADVSEILNDVDDLEAMRTIYAGEVWLADRHLKKFLDALEQEGVLDNTIVIFTADHGQSLGEGRRMGHGPVHRETVLRVPLIIADFRNPQHREVNTRAGTIDIAPTVASFTGLATPPDAAGQSLIDPDGMDPAFPYFAETAVRSTSDTNWQRVKDSQKYDVNALVVYSGDLKMVQKHGQYQLFRTGEELRIAQKVRKKKEPIMADYLQGLLESFQTTAVDQTPNELTESDLEALQGLGYTQ